MTGALPQTLPLRPAIPHGPPSRSPLAPEGASIIFRGKTLYFYIFVKRILIICEILNTTQYFCTLYSEYIDSIMFRCFNIVIQGFRRDFISDHHEHRRDKKYRFKQHRFRRRADRAIKRSPPWKEYNLHLIVLVLVVISMFIGIIEIEITDTISFLLLPLIYSLVMGLILYLSKSFKWIGPEQAKVAEGVMVLLIGVLLSKLTT